MPDEAACTLTDAELLARTAAGDTAAFERLVDRHEGPILRYLRGASGDADAADDAFQETFVSAWRAASSFRGELSARAWLLAIARRALARQRRRAHATQERPMSLEQLALLAGWGDPDAPDPGVAFEARELVERVFDGLTPEEREILILRDLEGFSGEETAQLLGLSLAAMKSRLHRARLRFVAEIGEKCDGV